MRKLSYNDKLCMQTLWLVSQSHCLVYAERLSQCGRLDCRLSYQCSTFTLYQGITGKWKWWLSRQVLAHEASAFNIQNLTP